METITINGREFVRLTDVCDILRHIRSDYPYDDTKKVVSMIANCMFYDEVMKAKTEEEREAAVDAAELHGRRAELARKPDVARRVASAPHVLRDHARAVEPHLGVASCEDDGMHGVAAAELE